MSVTSSFAMKSGTKLSHITPSILFVLFPVVLLLTSPSASLPITVRVARPRELRAIWLLRDSTTTCPRNVTHTSWDTPSEGTYTLRHNSIVQENTVCSFPSEDHTLTFHRRADYDDNLEPESDRPELPEETLRQLRGDTVAKRALQAGDRAGEDYLFGYEIRVRQCGGEASFEDGTVVFVYRPFTDKLKMEGVDDPLTRGLKWMVIAPRVGGLCVYSSDVNGPDDGPREDSDDGDSASGDGDGDGGGDGDGDGNRECFPADAKVLTRTRGLVDIADVVVGEFVAGGGGDWTKVIGFSHRDELVNANMMEIRTASGERVRASNGHYLYTSRGLTKAADVTVGDLLKIHDGTMSRVLRVSRTSERGLFNVQTMSGDVVVDGVWASTYTTAMPSTVAHAALAPLRMLARLYEEDIVMSIVPHVEKTFGGSNSFFSFL